MNSNEILCNLSKVAEKNRKVKRIYRYLLKEEFYRKAYYNSNITANNGINKMAADEFSKDIVKIIICQLATESYQPIPIKEIYITQKRNRKKIFDIPLFYDRLVQKIVKMLLDAIYKPIFLDTSYAFAPDKNCHTALSQVSNTFHDVNWFLEGDKTGLFDNINCNILIKILREKIDDERFIRLIYKFLNNGYLGDFQYNKTYSGTPQGGILSSTLANIYFNELDYYIEKIITDFRIGSLKDTIWNPIYKNMKYIRYADSFIIGVNGSKEDCIFIRNKIIEYLKLELRLDLPIEKILIINSKDRAYFLGYEIKIDNNQNGYNYVKLFMPKKIIEQIVVRNGMIKDINTHPWKIMPRISIMNYSDLEIIRIFNAELRSIYNYYCMAENISHKMGQLKYVMEYSCYKSFGSKYKCSVPKIIEKYRVDKRWGIRYTTKKGEKMMYFYCDGFKKQSPIKNGKIDKLPNTIQYASKCE